MNERFRLLIVDDEASARQLICASLGVEHFEFLQAPTGHEALPIAFAESPDLVLLDRRMPGMDGLEVLRRLRSHFVTRDVPVLLLTALGTIEDRIRGYQAGADDYILKPFDPEELKVRIQALLRRILRERAVDPLTKLPGNLMLREQMSERLAQESDFCVLYADLKHFKSYVDRYGFERASQVLQRLGLLLYEGLVQQGSPEDFIGHIGGDDFVLLVATENAESLCQEITQRFDQIVPGFYDEQDRNRGFLEGPDRFGTYRKFSLISLDVALIEVHPGEFKDRADLSSFVARCKEVVKKSEFGWQKFSRKEPPGGKPVPEQDATEPAAERIAEISEAQ